MKDSIIAFLLWWSSILSISLILWLSGQVQINLTWLAISIVIDGIYVRVILSNTKIPFINQIFPEPKFNWNGKIAAILVTSSLIVMVILLSQGSLADLGITMRQTEDSIRPVLIVTLAILLFMVLVVRLVGQKPKADRETIAYQATIPGLDEELYYRGLLLFTMSQAIIGIESSFLANPIAWSAILVTLLFALAHSLMVHEGQIQFDLATLILVLILGSTLMWMRVHTGSILLPLIAHNLINIVSNTAPLLWTSPNKSL